MKIPFLHNIRRGLATNSSSSHSLVFFAKETASSNIESAQSVWNEFGWDNFILDSLGEKLMYALTAAIGGYWGDDGEAELARRKEKWAHLFPEFDDKPDVWESAFQGYVDHGGEVPVTAEFIAKLHDPHTVIYGGNDNNDTDILTGTSWGDPGHGDLPAGVTERERLTYG